ncbi:MAG: class F sortase [Acidimicrobiia bacterium]
MASRPTRVVTAISVALIVGGVAAIALALSAQLSPPQPPLAAVDSSEPSVTGAGAALALPPSPPLTIDIPAIGVHSTLQYLGLTPDNRLEVPAPGPRFDEAAWYKYSATPGSIGPAVILGHVDSGGYGPSVFFDLGKLQPGDEVRITRGDGIVAIFRVDEVRRYRKVEFPTLLVYGQTPNATLRLVTCGGEFDRDTGHYLDNVIVFASLTGQA